MINLKLFVFAIVMLTCAGIDVQAQKASNSFWLRTNYNFATHLQRNPNKPEDGQTQMNYNQGVGIGLGHRHTLAKRWMLESNLSYQKKGFNTVFQVGDAFNPNSLIISELEVLDNYHYIDWNEVIWFSAVKHKNFSINIGAGLGLGALVGYHKGSDFWLLKFTSPEHTEYINAKPNTFAPFRYVGIELGIKDRFKIGFDNKNDIGRFIKTENFEAKNWVWSVNLNYLIFKIDN